VPAGGKAGEPALPSLQATNRVLHPYFRLLAIVLLFTVKLKPGRRLHRNGPYDNVRDWNYPKKSRDMIRTGNPGGF
jgi:hypothetical protein